MLTRYVSAATAVLFALAFVSLAAQPAPEKDTHEITSNQQIKLDQPIVDHEAIAQRFEAMAVQLEKQAAEHERLAKYYRSSPGAVPAQDAAKLALHSDRIAKNLKEVAADARDAAAIHRAVVVARRDRDKDAEIFGVDVHAWHVRVGNTQHHHECCDRGPCEAHVQGACVIPDFGNCLPSVAATGPGQAMLPPCDRVHKYPRRTAHRPPRLRAP